MRSWLRRKYKPELRGERTTREVRVKAGWKCGPICTASHDPQSRLGAELKEPK
jgi:hypothetical protein